ncbi:MAG: phage tail protein [Proteobacteria bacterium]|nr:phage tail protein [Pseudomonadota bacterium]
MSTSAQLAQGTKLYIAGSSGSAETISAAAAGYPTILTATAHGLANGDIAAIAGVVGTMGTDSANGLNGNSYTVKNITTNTFCIEANTTGLTYTSDGTATPSAWIQIKELKSIKPAGAAASSIDVTDLDSTAKEYRTGLMDNGSFSCDIQILESDPGQAAALAAFAASSILNYKVETTAKTRTFEATCLKFPTIPDSSVDGVQTGTAEWQISGDITVA